MIGKQVKELRRLLGISQATLARFLDVHTLTVSRWERGTSNPPKGMETILEILDMASKEAKGPEVFANVTKYPRAKAYVLYYLLRLVYEGK